MNQELGIRELCAKYGIRPSKRLGQNFLVDARIVRMLVDAANLNAEDYVVEIGPGFGMLTVEMAKIVKKVVAVEVDHRLARVGQELLASYNNVEILQGDILKMTNQKLVELLIGHPEPRRYGRGEGSHTVQGVGSLHSLRSVEMTKHCSYKVVASLPYSITSAALRKFTEPQPSLRGGEPPLSDGRPTLMVVLVQKEVAERVCAKPGGMSMLSVAVQYYGRPEIVGYVPRTSFWPQPDVDSAILRIVTGYRLQVTGYEVDEKRLFQVVRIGFSSRRKQLQNNLMAGLRLPREKALEALRRVGLQPTVRAQELGVKDWIALSKNL